MLVPNTANHPPLKYMACPPAAMLTVHPCPSIWSKMLCTLSALPELQHELVSLGSVQPQLSLAERAKLSLSACCQALMLSLKPNVGFPLLGVLEGETYTKTW